MSRKLSYLALALGLLAAAPPPSRANFLTKIGVGGYGGFNIPIVQDDAENGPIYGIRGRIGIPFITIEPAINFIENGDADVDIEGGGQITLEAPEVTSYSFSALWGGAYYGLAGIGWSDVNIPGGAGESSEVTYSFGGGAEFGVGPVAIDVSPRLFIINTADSASRKNVGVLIGVNYYFF